MYTTPKRCKITLGEGAEGVDIGGAAVRQESKSAWSKTSLVKNLSDGVMLKVNMGNSIFYYSPAAFSKSWRWADCSERCDPGGCDQGMLPP
jgi:hypothetical protein